jgi:hypothetical protein
MNERRAPMGQLWSLVRAYLDRQEWPPSERQLAQRLGYRSSSTFDNWREPKGLPSAQALARFARVSGDPYQRVLEAALSDCGYLPQPVITDEPVAARRSNAKAKNVRPAAPADESQDPGGMEPS